jgi:hypothetical protein
MSKKYSEDLFELIQRMSRSEKRYFKEFASRHTIGTINKIVVLFNKIEKQSRKSAGEYDEEKIIAKLTVPDKRRLPDLKLHLYKIILRSLNAYYSSSNIEITLKNQLISIQVLYEKALYKQCLKLVEKCKELGRRYEKTIILMDVLEWEKKIAMANSYVDKSHKEIDQLYKTDTEKLIYNYKLSTNLSYLRAKSLKERRKGYLRSERDLNFQRDLIQRMNNLSAKNILSHRDLSHLYNFQSNYYFSISDYKRSCKLDTKQMEIMEEKIHLIEEEPRLYVTVINNLILSLLNLEEFDKMPPLIKKLRNLKVKSLRIKNDILMLANNRELGYYMNTGQFKPALEFVNAANKELQNKTINKNEEMVWAYITGSLYIVIVDYKKARRAFQQIINENNMDIQSDLVCYSSILMLIIYFELEDTTMLEYNYKSVYRFLYKRNRLYKFESLLLNFLKTHAHKMITKRQISAGFKKLKRELLPLTKHNYEKKAFEYFDFISWLDSKIENLPLQQVVLRNLKR